MKRGGELCFDDQVLNLILPFQSVEHLHTGAQFVTLEYKIKSLSLAVFSFGNPSNKTVTGTANTWGLLIANHLD